MNSTVVILLSDKRSGSTMLQDELCKHPDIQHVEYSPHTYFETHHWLKAAVMLDMAPETFSGNKTYRGYGSASNAKAYLLDCVINNVPEFTIPDNDRELVFQGWESICKHFAKPVFFEKSPQFLAQWASLSLMLEWIEMTEFDVKIIGLTRNPLSVIYSANKLFYTDPEKRQFGWLEIQKNLLALKSLLPEGSFYHCRYEDIIDNPVQAFAEICRFVGVSTDCNIGKDVHSKSVNKWKDDCYFTIQLDEAVKQIARHFGYSEVDLDNPPKPEPSLLYKIKLRITSSFVLMYSGFGNRILKPIILKFYSKNS